MKVDVTLVSHLNQSLIDYTYARSGFAMCRKNALYVPDALDLFANQQELQYIIKEFGGRRRFEVYPIPELVKVIREVRKHPSRFLEFITRKPEGHVLYELGDIYNAFMSIRKLDTIRSQLEKQMAKGVEMTLGSEAAMLHARINRNLDKLSQKRGGLTPATAWSRKHWPEWLEKYETEQAIRARNQSIPVYPHHKIKL